MSKLSVIIPSRNERFMPETVNDIFSKSTGDIEVIVVLEGGVPEQLPQKNKNLSYIVNEPAKGMRAAINAAVAVSRGEYLLKCDAHCMFEVGFDEVLKANMQDNWIVIPRRHSLDPINWTLDHNGKSGRDYHYLDFPAPDKPHDAGMHGVEWPQRSRERANNPKYDIDDTMSFQGSCWFMKKTWFTDFLGGMSEKGYGSFSQEPQEIGNKTWLGGGEIKVNKLTWYAHLHKGKTYGRMYHQNNSEIVAGHLYSSRHWMNNEEPGILYEFKWLINKFSPVPGWPDNWQSIWDEIEKERQGR
jgi:glycosyltransferase involved in cell wall biosynthesis